VSTSTTSSISGILKGAAGVLAAAVENTDYAAAAHHARHENAGADEISVAGLSGELADPQPPKAHKASHENGGADEISVADLSGRLDGAQPIEYGIDEDPETGTFATRTTMNFLTGAGMEITDSYTNAPADPEEVPPRPARSVLGLTIAASAAARGYALQAHMDTPFTIPNNATRYFGANGYVTSFQGGVRLYIPRAGTIKWARFLWYAETAGSTGNVSLYVRLNESSQELVATVNTSANTKLFVNDSMSMAVAAGDYIEMKITSPSWGTLPQNIHIGGVLWIE